MSSFTTKLPIDVTSVFISEQIDIEYQEEEEGKRERNEREIK